MDEDQKESVDLIPEESKESDADEENGVNEEIKESILEEIEEEVCWKKAQAKDTLSAYYSYLYDYPEGKYTAEARKKTARIEVKNTGDRPIQVGSHYHFFEVNKMLEIQQKKYQQKLEQLKTERENLLKSATKRMDEVKAQLEKDYKEKLYENEKILKEKIADEQSLLTKRLQEELDEKTQKLKQMIELEAQNIKLKREKDSMKEEFELELQKKLSEQILTEKTKLKQAIDAENELVIIQYKKQLEYLRIW